MALLSGAISIWESAYSRGPARRLRHKRTRADARLKLGIMNTRILPTLGKQKRYWRKHDGHGAGNNSPYRRTRQRHVSLDAIGDRCRGHGDDRELPIWLDVLRPRHPKEVWLGSRFDPVGVYAICFVRNLARAGRRMVCR